MTFVVGALMRRQPVRFCARTIGGATSGGNCSGAMNDRSHSRPGGAGPQPVNVGVVLMAGAEGNNLRCFIALPRSPASADSLPSRIRP